MTIERQTTKLIFCTFTLHNKYEYYLIESTASIGNSEDFLSDSDSSSEDSDDESDNDHLNNFTNVVDDNANNRNGID